MRFLYKPLIKIIRSLCPSCKFSHIPFERSRSRTNQWIMSENFVCSLFDRRVSKYPIDMKSVNSPVIKTDTNERNKCDYADMDPFSFCVTAVSRFVGSFFGVGGRILHFDQYKE